MTLLYVTLPALLSVATARERMNFVFMFPDTLRAESFSSYGLPLNTTPHLDAFAKTGVRFEQTHVQHTQCSPSRVAMLTGRYMHVLGHRTQTNLIQPFEFNYFQILKDNGYHIEYYGKNDVFSNDALNVSVSHWDGRHTTGMSQGPSAIKYPENGYYSMLYTAGGDAYDPHKNGDYNAVVKAVEWMKNAPPQPFLMFIPGSGAHPPYGAPKQFHDMWPVDLVKKHVKLRKPYLEGKPKYHSKEKGIPHYRQLTSMEDDFFYKIQATYLAMLSYVDWIFGQLLQGIKDAGLEHNTAIFFSSDHGDFGGDFHMVEKWPGAADDILTRVPLFARIPGASPAAAGFVSKAPVELFDIPHTMCDLAGINLTCSAASCQYGVMFGHSLKRQLLFGHEGDTSRYVYSEGGFGYPNEVFPGGSDHVNMTNPAGLYWPRALEEMSDNGNGSPKFVMRRNLTHKLVYRPKGESELYDLTRDPREIHNLWHEPAYAGLKAELLSGLMEWHVQTGDVSPQHQDARGMPHFPQPASTCTVNHKFGPMANTAYGSEQFQHLDSKQKNDIVI